MVLMLWTQPASLPVHLCQSVGPRVPLYYRGILCSTTQYLPCFRAIFSPGLTHRRRSLQRAILERAKVDIIIVVAWGKADTPIHRRCVCRVIYKHVRHQKVGPCFGEGRVYPYPIWDLRWWARSAGLRLDEPSGDEIRTVFWGSFGSNPSVFFPFALLCDRHCGGLTTAVTLTQIRRAPLAQEPHYRCGHAANASKSAVVYHHRLHSLELKDLVRRKSRTLLWWVTAWDDGNH